MAREYAKLLTRIWADQDFKALTGSAQRLYFQIISQPDISMAGVVTLSAKRWSLQVADQDSAAIAQALGELQQHLFIVVDEETQEVLVRSYVRSDECWRSPTSMKGVESAVRGVLSDGLKAVIRDELLRIDTSRLSAKVSEKTGRSTREFVEGIIWGIAEDFKHLSHTPSDTPSDAPCDGHKRIPHSTTTTPEPTTTPTPTTPKNRRSYPERFESFWKIYPKSDDKRAAFKAWERAITRATPEEIEDGARRYRDDPNREPQYTKNGATWLNADAWENGPLPARAAPQTFGQAKSQRLNQITAQYRQEDPWTSNRQQLSQRNSSELLQATTGETTTSSPSPLGLQVFEGGLS